MYVTVLPEIGGFSLRRRPLGEYPLAGGSLFRFGRDAVYAAAQALGIGAGQNIIMPAYLCDSVIMALGALGIGVRYYDVSPDMSIDVGALERLVDSRTKAIYAVHYFGIPPDLLSLAQLCKRHGLYLIEDRAHTLPPSPCEHVAPARGDAIIYSLRKFVRLPEGGALVLADGRAERGKGVRLSARMQAGTMLRLALSAGKRAFLAAGGPAPSPQLIKKTMWDSGIATGSARQETYGYAASAWVGMALRRVRFRDIARRRRDHFRRWADALKNIPGVRPLAGTLPDGAVPFCFPVAVANRQAVKRHLAAHGVWLEATFSGAPFLLENVLNPADPLEGTRWLAAHLLSLPVHEQLSSAGLSRIAGWLAEATNGAPSVTWREMTHER